MEATTGEQIAYIVIALLSIGCLVGALYVMGKLLATVLRENPCNDQQNTPK